NGTSHGNRAETDAGVMRNGQGTLALNNVTVTANTADSDGNGSGDGGGVGTFSGSLALRNTIVAGNVDAGGQRPDCTGSLLSQGYNLLGGSCSSFLAGSISTGNLVTANPKLGALGSNGGATWTHALLAGSPALD